MKFIRLKYTRSGKSYSDSNNIGGVCFINIEKITCIEESGKTIYLGHYYYVLDDVSFSELLEVIRNHK